MTTLKHEGAFIRINIDEFNWLKFALWVAAITIIAKASSNLIKNEDEYEDENA
jgi:hypothetical protein